MSLIVLTPPPLEPVSVDELQAHLHLPDQERDLLRWYLQAAVEVVQNKARRVLITTRFRKSVLSPPTGTYIKLMRSPLIEVLLCEDEDGNAVEYELDDVTAPYAFLRPLTSTSALTIEFTAGYGDLPENVPHCARQAVRVAASHYWRHRGDDDMPALPPAVDALLDPIRIREVA